MNITNVKVTKVAEEKTANGLYTIEYCVDNKVLSQVQATIQEKEADPQSIPSIIGSIFLTQGTITCSLPDTRNLAPYFTDFDIFLKAIRESILTEE